MLFNEFLLFVSSNTKSEIKRQYTISSITFIESMLCSNILEFINRDTYAHIQKHIYEVLKHLFFTLILHKVYIWLRFGRELFYFNVLIHLFIITMLHDFFAVLDECFSDPCQNNGTCLDDEMSYTCFCNGTGFSGVFCETGNV